MFNNPYMPMYQPIYNPQQNGDDINRRIEETSRKLEELNRMKDKYTQPVNNIINTQPLTNSDMFEWRILNENEEVDNLYVQNKTLFVSDDMMILKGTDGKLEKWKIKKIYPIDSKDIKIEELSKKVEELEAKLNEHNEPIKSTKNVK